MVAEGQAMKPLLNETRAGGQPSGECSPNSFLLLWSYRRAGNYFQSRFLTCFLLLQLFMHHYYGFVGVRA
ncbi:hypothetical protein DVG78_08260 [Runella aurantiaca]|uniref:Uncharacterized protein n=1 Tax=Runella aurantiaca TaxID=2282308 RepID=A0A369IFI2_9BACT|nr:hypothetical protein DVG78_08260 [Runella aurantiaca]